MRIRRHKYNAKSSKCINGHYHPSKLEGGYCTKLEMLLRAKEIRGYETQVTFEMWVNDQKICSHIVDFVVERLDGVKEIHECKGVQMPVWNIKRKLCEALYPEIEYIVIT